MAVKIRILGEFDPKGFNKAEQALGSLGRTAGAVLGGLAAVTTAAVVGSIREFANFDAAMTKSTAIMGNLSEAMRKDMADAAREVAKTTTFSAEQAAESFFFLASAGLDAEASIAALPQVASFAQAGMFDMARATDLLTDAQSALGLTIRDDAVANMENMARVSDVLVKANILANASVEQFSTSLTTKAGAALRAVGKDLEEGVAVLAAFADQGIKGEQAGTQLGIVLRDLSTRAIKNKEEFQKYGIAVFDANGNMNNLADIIGSMEQALGGMSAETARATLMQLGFSDKSLGSLQALLGTSDAIRGYEAELRNASGTTEEVAGNQLDTLNSQLELLKSAFIDVAINVGEQMTPAFRDLIDRVKELLPELGERLVAALQQIDFAQIAEDVADFTVSVVENIDQIIEVGKQIAIAAGVIIAYTTALKLATIAQGLFNAIAMKNPYVLIALAAITAGIAIANVVINVNEQRKALEDQAEAAGRTVEEQKKYNEELERYLRMQENVRNGIGNGTIATREFSAATSMLREELLKAENIRMNGIVAEIRRVRNEAIQASYAASLLNEDLRKIARYGGQESSVKPPLECPHGNSILNCPICNKMPGGAGAVARDVVKDFYDSIADEVAKQQARLDLATLGLSEGLINQILGSADWQKVFDNIVEGGRYAAQELQRLFNQTAAGIRELAQASQTEEARLVSEIETREALARWIVDQQYNAAMERFEKFRNLLLDFTDTAVNAFSVFRGSLFPADEFGRFEGSVVSLQNSLIDLIEAQTELFTDANKRVLRDYVQQSTETMRQVARAREEIASAIEEEQRKLEDQLRSRDSMFESVFNRIIGSADISKFEGTANSMIRQLRRTVEQAINFETQLNELRALGLSDRAIQQIETAGVQSGSATARALLRGGESAITEINSLYGQLEAVAGSQAESQASRLFDSGIALSQGLIDGMLSRQDELRRTAEIMAEIFETTFNQSVASAAIQFSEPNYELMMDAQRAYIEWLQNLPALGPGEQRVIVGGGGGGVVVSGPGEGLTFAGSGNTGASQQVSGGNTINITVNAGLGTNGGEVGEAVVNAITRYESRNGRVFARP